MILQLYGCDTIIILLETENRYKCKGGRNQS